MSRRAASRLAVPAVAVALSVLASPRGAHADPAHAPSVPDRVIPQPDRAYSYKEPQIRPTLGWWLTQLVPSPEIAGGTATLTTPAGGAPGAPVVTSEETKLAFGLRWQLTPVLWSWGTSRHVSRWRFLVADPLARHAGSIELHTTLEYVWGHVDRMIVRPGVRAYFPLHQRGEYLSASIGTSTYSYDETMRVAYDAGIYTLFGLFGLEVTAAPANAPLTAIGTFRIRYF